MRLHSRRLRLRMGGKQRQPQAKDREPMSQQTDHNRIRTPVT